MDSPLQCYLRLESGPESPFLPILALFRFLRTRILPPPRAREALLLHPLQISFGSRTGSLLHL